MLGIEDILRLFCQASTVHICKWAMTCKIQTFKIKALSCIRYGEISVQYGTANLSSERQVINLMMNPAFTGLRFFQWPKHKTAFILNSLHFITWPFLPKKIYHFTQKEKGLCWVLMNLYKLEYQVSNYSQHQRIHTRLHSFSPMPLH